MVTEPGLARVLCGGGRDTQVLQGPRGKVRIFLALFFHLGRLKCCGRFDLLKYIHLEHEVIRAEWDGQAHRWRLQVRRADQTVFEDDCDVFINAGGTVLLLDSWSSARSNGRLGVLNAWKWPDIKGLHDFKGTLCHTARWPKDLDHKGTFSLICSTPFVLAF